MGVHIAYIPSSSTFKHMYYMGQSIPHDNNFISNTKTFVRQ